MIRKCQIAINIIIAVNGGKKVINFVKYLINIRKNSYLYSVYPDGKGPLAELISSLEHDVVE